MCKTKTKTKTTELKFCCAYPKHRVTKALGPYYFRSSWDPFPTNHFKVAIRVRETFSKELFQKAHHLSGRQHYLYFYTILSFSRRKHLLEIEILKDLQKLIAIGEKWHRENYFQLVYVDGKVQ